MRKNNRYASRRSTPWDENAFLTPSQSFVKQGFLERYTFRHPNLKALDEKSLLNSYTPECCPLCESVAFIKDGYNSYGIQRYKCKDCNKRFTVITDTIFDNHKIGIKEWIDYLLELFGYVSFKAISRSERISDTTTKYWLIKLFELLKDYQNNLVLEGRVYLDETYYKVIKSEESGIKNGKGNLYSIGVAIDGVYTLAFIENKSRNVTREAVCRAFKSHIKEGSTLVHDNTRAHDILIENLSLISESYSSKDPSNPLQPINDTHSLLKQFLRAHRGFSRDYLQDYLNLFCFMYNPPYNNLEKIEFLIDKALRSRVCIRYRDTFSRKADK